MLYVRVLAAFLCLLHSSLLLAQRQLEGPFRLAIDPYNNQAQILQNDHAEGFSLFLQDKQSVWSVKVNDSLQIETPVKLINPGANNDLVDYVGGIHETNRAVLFYSNQKRTKLRATVVNYQNGQVETKPLVLPLDKHEKPWCYYILDSKLYVLAENQKDSTLNVATVNSDLVVEKRNYSVANTFLFQKPQHADDYLFNAANKHKTATVIIPQSVYQTQHTFTSVKLYPRSGALLLTSDKEREFTSYVRIDLSSGAVTEQIFPQPTVDEGYKTNSFVYDDQLFQVRASRQTLKLAVTDIRTQQVLATHQLDRKGPLTFGEPILYQHTVPTDKTAVLFRELYKGLVNTTQLAIAVNKEEGKYQCQIGAFESTDIIYYYCHTISTIPLTGNISASFGLPIPVASTNHTVNTYFWASLSTESLSCASAPYAKTMQGKIARFQHRMGDQIGIETMALRQGYYLYGFYHKRQNTYTISAYPVE